MQKGEMSARGGSASGGKTKKGNVAVIAIIVVIVAITAGVVGYLFARKTQAPVEKIVITQQVQPVTPVMPENIISNSSEISPEKIANDFPACNGDTACGSTCSYNGEAYSSKMFASSCWMTRNINTITKADGKTPIVRYCYDKDENNCKENGGIYLWADAMGLPAKCNVTRCDIGKNYQGICPSGWHVSTNNDVDLLATNYSFLQLTSDTNIGFGKILSGERHYAEPGNNLPNWDGGFIDMDYRGHLWTSDQKGTTGAVSWLFNSYDNTIESSYITINKAVGFSVRCVKNQETRK